MTLEEALEIGNGKAMSFWRVISLKELRSRPRGQTIGKLIVKSYGRNYSIAAKKYEENMLSFMTTDVPGNEELCMVVTAPPYMALTQDGWQPIIS